MKIFKIISFLVFVLLVSNTIVLLRDYIRTPHQIRNLLFQEGDILEGMSTGPSEISVNYNKQISTGSPLIFGGAKSPNSKNQDAWNKISESGATSIRIDYFLEWTVPSNTTIESYKANINNVQSTETWQKQTIEEVLKVMHEAKKRKLMVMGILAFAPKWLTYSGTMHGVPKDWDVYESLIKNVYSIYRDNTDYFEVWNEPDHTGFLNISNSGLTPIQAYREIYRHAAKAIREVDSEKKDGIKAKIGGPVISTPKNTEFIKDMLNDPYISENIDFISYHNYEQINEPSDTPIKYLLQTYKRNIPIMLTEWNYTSEIKAPNPYLTSNLAIPYQGKKFLSFLNMELDGAYFYSFYPLLPNSQKQYDGYLSFYKQKNDYVELLPMAKTWRLLSKSMTLGKGVSKIYESVGSTPSTLLPFLTDELSSVGFENINNHQGVAMVNDQDQDKYVAVTLNGVNPGKFGRVKIDMYVASADYDGGQVISSEIYPAKNSQVKLQLLLPSQSVIGLLISPDTPLQDVIRTLIP